MRRLIGSFAVVAVLVGVLAGPASAASQGRIVVARISGGGTALMQPTSFAQGITHWGAGVTLYDDFTASGHFDCVDQQGGTDPGNIFGEVTSWRWEGTTMVLEVDGTFVGRGGHPGPQPFTVKIQEFGGAGVGRWTLQIGTFVFCIEVVTSGQIRIR